jgi:hypothetical protein
MQYGCRRHEAKLSEHSDCHRISESADNLDGDRIPYCCMREIWQSKLEIRVSLDRQFNSNRGFATGRSVSILYHISFPVCTSEPGNGVAGCISKHTASKSFPSHEETVR